MTGVEQLLTELADPRCYPHAPPSVDIVQTHLSVVCLAGDLVYKLKKARRLPFADFSRLDARRQFCREEVRLNRRLCPDIYLGTTALRRIGAGLRFAPVGDDEGGDVAEVAVVMRRLPADRMLDRLLEQRLVTAPQIESLARLVAAFHRTTLGDPMAHGPGDPLLLRAAERANFAELASIPDHGLDPGLLRAVDAASDGAFAAILPALQTRAPQWIVDGHGDLHARNICMTEPPRIYDCIEFAPSFRCGDVATENAFLVMDLRYRGAPELASCYLGAYVADSGDTGQQALMPPLVAYRAMVRAKVATFAAAEPELAAADRVGARSSAARHLRLAAATLVEGCGPLWVVVCGAPGTGKTALCRELAAIAGWPHLATDVVRKRLAGLPAGQRGDAAIYQDPFSDRTYAAVAAQATNATRRGAAVVLLDGNFPTPTRRAAAAAAAAAAGARLCCVVVTSDAATALARLSNRERARDPGDASDATVATFATLQARFEPPTAAEGIAIATIDGGGTPTEVVDRVLAALLDTTTRRAMTGPTAPG